MSPELTFEQRWEAALAEFELDLAEAAACLNADHTPAARDPWQPPAGLGPLPASLRTRAETLLARQIEVGRQLAEAASLSRRQASVLRTMRTAGPARPLYVDMAG